MSAPAASVGSPSGSPWVGRTFLHPAVDYLLVGGGLGLVVIVLLWLSGKRLAAPTLAAPLPALLFLTNVSHVGASMVRLYSLPNAFQRHRFLTMGLPLLTFATMSLAMLWPGELGQQLHALSLTGLPFHHTQQACALTLIYFDRSGVALERRERRGLLAACLLPSLAFFLQAPGSGIEWLASPLVFVERPWLGGLRQGLAQLLACAALVAPPLGYAFLARRRRRIPLIGLLLVVSNAVWWTLLVYLDAFAWATVFHGLQYLAISPILYNRERAVSGGRYAWLHRTLWFYGASLLLGYALFQLVPQAWAGAGFAFSQSVLLVNAALNMHHFVVDFRLLRMGARA